MSTTFQPLYGTRTALAITSANSLVNSTSTSTGNAGSAAVDNTVNRFEDALVGVAITPAAAGVSATGQVVVYAYALVDGTHYNDGVTGTDATQTLASPTNLKLLGTVSVDANSTPCYDGLFSVARAFDGWMPDRWGIVIQNLTGATLAASGNAAFFLPVNGQGS